MAERIHSFCILFLHLSSDTFTSISNTVSPDDTSSLFKGWITSHSSHLFSAQRT